eukprot:1160781-Pelagomonas_calceolata.AAC.18
MTGMANKESTQALTMWPVSFVLQECVRGACMMFHLELCCNHAPFRCFPWAPKTFQMDLLPWMGKLTLLRCCTVQRGVWCGVADEAKDACKQVPSGMPPVYPGRSSLPPGSACSWMTVASGIELLVDYVRHAKSPCGKLLPWQPQHSGSGEALASLLVGGPLLNACGLLAGQLLCDGEDRKLNFSCGHQLGGSLGMPCCMFGTDEPYPGLAAKLHSGLASSPSIQPLAVVL